MAYMTLETFILGNINDKENLLLELADIGDDDFIGNNGEDYTWDDALDAGFDSTQEYVLSLLEKSDLRGEALVSKYLSYWLENDSYYTGYEHEFTYVGDVCVLSLVTLH